jgi:hypothetical protein
MAQGYGNNSNDPQESLTGEGTPADADDSSLDQTHHAQMRRGRFLAWGLGGVGALALIIAACSGDNLFTGNNVESRPQIVSRLHSQVAVAGDTLNYSVGAIAPRNVASITFQFSGALSGDTIITVTPPTATSNTNLRLRLPFLLTDTVLFVRITARDVTGVVSTAVTDTIRAIAPPAVVAIDRPDSITPNTTLTLRVRVIGLRKVTRILLSLRGATSKDTTVTVPIPANDITESVDFNIPVAPQDTVLTILAAAVDQSNLQGPTSKVTIPVKVGSPQIISVTSVDTISPGSTVDFRVTASSLRQIQRINFSFRNAVVRDTFVTVSPPATNTTQDLSLTVPGNVTDTILTVRITAIDRVGGTSAVFTKTLRVRSGGPVVTSLIAPDSAQAGRTFDMRISASGNRPITTINVQLRGAVDRDIPINVNPPAVNTTQDLSVLLPDTARDTLLVVRVTATDQGGIVSSIVTKTIRIRDASAPTVTAFLTQTTVGAGRTISLRVTAQDNVSLAKIGFLVLNSSNTPIDSVISSVASGSRKDTTFAYTISPALQPTTLKFQGLAIDRQGLRGLSVPVSLGVVDSTKPLVDILSPAPASTFPLNDSILVRVHVADISGIRSVQFSGISVRTDSVSNTTVVQRYNPKTVTFPQAPQTVLPKDTVIVRYLTAVNDSFSEPIRIIVSASDSVGNVGADTNIVSVGGPRVEIRNPANGSQVLAGGTLPVRVFAVDKSSGIDSLRLDANGPGAFTQTIVWRGLITPDSVVKDTLIVLPNTPGNMTLTASAYNRRGIVGRTATPVVIILSTSVAADTAKPQVSVVVGTNGRVELDDSIPVTVTAADIGSSGLKRIGITAFMIRTDGVAADTAVKDTVFPGSRTGTLQRIFYLSPRDFGLSDTTRLPLNVTLQVHAFARDTVRNCGAAVHQTLETFACVRAVIRLSNSGALDTFYVASGNVGQSTNSQVVTGKTVKLPNPGGIIADAVVDTVRKRLFLTDITAARVNVLNMDSTKFISPTISVGAEPWGMTIDNSGDTLIVANSGGTNISFVPINALDAPGQGKPAVPFTEKTLRRLLTPNNVLFDVKTSLINALFRYTLVIHDYSDRPQFIAQDSLGRLLYSTKPTGSATQGTIRIVTQDPDANPATGDTAEVRILFNQDAILPGATDVVAVANVDSIRIRPGGIADDSVTIYDHIAGQPHQVIFATRVSAGAAAVAIAALGSDVLAFVGSWDDNHVGLSDTTFVSASGNRNRIAFGEGATGPTGRIVIWSARDSAVSAAINVVDLIHNASERVLGVSLNKDGTMGVARGTLQAYYFDQDLRLQGQFGDQISGGKGGAAFHPHHVAPITESNDSSISFVATPNRTIRIIDTSHFNLRGELPIRDNIGGPVKTTPPIPGDNASLPPGACIVAPINSACVVLKLYGVTSTGGVVVVNVRRRDYQ